MQADIKHEKQTDPRRQDCYFVRLFNAPHYPSTACVTCLYTKHAHHNSAEYRVGTASKGAVCAVPKVLIMALGKVGPLGWQQLLHLLRAVV